MAVTDLPFAVLRLQYRVARTPLRLLEAGVISRLDQEAPQRLLFQRVFGAVDATVGNLLKDYDLEQSGIARVEQAVALAEAGRLDEVAEQKRREAAEELHARRAEAQEAPQRAREEAQERVQNARQSAEQRKRNAEQQAASRTAAVKNDIDRAAEQKVQAAEKAKESVQNRSRAAEKAVTSTAASELDDAAAKQSAASGARANADRLEDLAETEKEKRQAARESRA